MISELNGNFGEMISVALIMLNCRIQFLAVRA